MITESLEELGLSKPEAMIYLALLEHGPSLAGFLAKKTQVNRTTTYDALERLLKKDFITYTITAKRKLFRAKNPSSLASYYRDKAKEAAKLADELSKIKIEDKKEFEIFEGRKGINSILSDVLKSREYVAYGSAGGFLDVMRHDYIAFQNRKKELKIKARVIEPEVNDELRSIVYGQVRYLKEKESAPTTTIIYRNKVAMMIWSIIPHGILITNGQIADQYRRHFEILWKKATAD
jgi:sugar-specific transcriptional regulator TrmB